MDRGSRLHVRDAMTGFPRAYLLLNRHKTAFVGARGRRCALAPAPMRPHVLGETRSVRIPTVGTRIGRCLLAESAPLRSFQKASSFVKRSPLAMPIALIALASLLAACSSGTTGMLPANPQAQSLSQAPNRAAGSATSGGGMHATAHTPNGNTLLLGVNPAAGQSPTGTTPISNFGSGIGMARPMADQGPPSSCTSTGTCTTCPNGSQGDICEGGTGGGYNPDPPPPDGGGGGIPCQGQCGGGGRGPVTPCSKTNIKACVATSNPYKGAPCDGAEAHGIQSSPGSAVI